MKRHQRELWSQDTPREMLIEARCLVKNWSTSERNQEYTWRLRKKGYDLALFTVGMFMFHDTRLSNCTYNLFLSLSKDDLRDYVRFHEIPSNLVLCHSQELASYVNGVVFSGFQDFFTDVEEE